MDRKFCFEIDRSLDLIRTTLRGLYTLDDAHAYVKARREAHEALGWSPYGHLTLSDVREMKIQSQEVISAIRETLLAEPHYLSRRVAFVAAPSLIRNQLMRALGGVEGRCFDDPEAAEAWLLAEDKAPARHAAE